MKYQCIALDFDDTLAYFADNREGLWQPFRDLGFSDEEIRAAYKVCRAQTIHVGSGLTEELSKIRDISEHEPQIVERINDWAVDQVRLFEDVMPFIERTAKNYAVVIVTAGYTGLQQLKIQSTPLKDLKTVITGGSKVEAIKSLLERFGSPIIFVDDKPSVFEDLLAHGISPEDVEMVQISRDKAFLNHAPLAGCKQVVSLTETLQYIK